MISEYIKSLLASLTLNDPVYSCDVYLNEGCSYVDGADCNMKLAQCYLIIKNTRRN